MKSFSRSLSFKSRFTARTRLILKRPCFDVTVGFLYGIISKILYEMKIFYHRVI